METTVIDFYGGPGCGKSVMAAEVYAELSKRGCHVELVREYVKTWAWNGTKIKKWDELYIFAKQLKAESDLYGKVTYLITDRPLGMSCVYANLYGSAEAGFRMRDFVNLIMVEQRHDGITHTPIIVSRCHPYEQEGRFETAEQAIAVDMQCFSYLYQTRESEFVCNTVQQVMKRIGEW